MKFIIIIYHVVVSSSMSHKFPIIDDLRQLEPREKHEYSSREACEVGVTEYLEKHKLAEGYKISCMRSITK